HQLGHAGLHAKRGLVLVDARGDLGVAHIRKLRLVQFCNGVDQPPSVLLGVTFRARQEQHRIAARAELNALIDARQKAGAPEAGPRASEWAREQDYVSGQALALGAEPVGDPGAQARTARTTKACMQEELGRGVVELLRVYRLDDGKLIGDRGHPRQELRDFRAALAVSLERVA